MKPFKTLALAAITSASLMVGFQVSSAHARVQAPATHRSLVAATNDFGYWFTYYARNNYTPRSRLLPPSVVNARIAADMTPSLLARTPYHNDGILTGLMHIGNIPSGYRFTVTSNDGRRATEVMRLLFGSNPHTPIVRLYWTYTATGWKLADVTFLRTS